MAVRLGVVNVQKMLRSMTAKQFVEWAAYAQLEPFDEMRADYRAAYISSMIFNMAVAAKDRKPLNDFLLKWDSESEPPKPKQTWQEQQAIARMIVAAYSTPGLDM